MKKILITFAATTALWASVAWGADKLQYIYVLSPATIQSLAEQYEQVYNAGYAAYRAYQACKNST